MSHVLIQCSILNFEGGMPCVPVRTLASKGTLRTDCKLQKPVVLPHSFPSQNLAVSGICPCQVKLLPYSAPCFCKSASAIVPLCQTSLPFPCVRHGSISLLPRKVPAPQKAVSSGSSLCCCTPCVCSSHALSPAVLTVQPRDTSCAPALALLTGALAGQWTPASSCPSALLLQGWRVPK